VRDKNTKPRNSGASSEPDVNESTPNKFGYSGAPKYNTQTPLYSVKDHVRAVERAFAKYTW